MFKSIGISQDSKIRDREIFLAEKYDCKECKEMSKRLYIGNLPFSVTNDALKQLFSEYGEISESGVVVNKFNGRSKGFGFVTVSDDSQAEKAISEMNGKEVEGRAIVVTEAKPFDPDKPRPRRNFGGGFGGRREGGFNRDRGRSFGRRSYSRDEE
ncbi:MAG TPA: RNA-binding protein [Candidatus Paceibacterota bacterium]|nr:RNA-binding protein [Candidatus Paceibacterota bacterium]